MEATNTNDEPAFLDVHGVAARYDVKHTTIWDWSRQGKMPQPLRFSGGCSRWSLADLEQWEDQLRGESAPRHEWDEMQRRKRPRSVRK